MKNTLILCFMLLGIIISACDDDDDDNNDDPNNTTDAYIESFDELYSEKDTLNYMDTTRVIAVASGKGLKYTWRTNSNAPLLPIDGVDSEIYFYADPCVSTGAKQVICEVSAGEDKMTKIDTIVIAE
ncbi:MAG: hypothetical protein U9Q98_07160 [Bacteroidota bacterium]|nr:hypothetical protein [Bacteroidota bacterium]